MSNNRKKKISFHDQKIAKAHHKNEYFKKMKYIINTIANDNLFSLIPTWLLEGLYIGRPHSFIIKPSPDTQLPKEFVESAKRLISVWSKNETITIIPDKLNVTIEEYITICSTIKAIEYYTEEPDSDVKLSAVYKLKMKYYLDNFNSFFSEVFDKTSLLLNQMGSYASNIGNRLIWLNYELKDTSESYNGSYNLIYIYAGYNKTESICIDGSNRPITQVGFPFAFDGILLAKMKLSVFNIKNSFSDLPLDVYIQSHALIRIYQRVDCIYLGFTHLHLFNSLMEPKIAYDCNGRILIEYRIFNEKIGYLRADIIDGKVIIKTFLFITNASTPEGVLLAKNTGLLKEDIAFLSFDHLSTFMNSDLANNMELRSILKAGKCEFLVEMYRKLKPILTKQSNYINTELIHNYLINSKLNSDSETTT